jgi:hypothetical protein
LPFILNEDQGNGNDNIVFDGVNIEGKWDQFPSGTAWIGPQNPTMIVLRVASRYVESEGQVCEGFQMMNCRIENWPGKPPRCLRGGGSHLSYSPTFR